MKISTINRTLVLKLILLFIGSFVLSYLSLTLIKYNFFRHIEAPKQMISMQQLTKEGSSDTVPEQKTQEKSEEKPKQTGTSDTPDKKEEIKEPTKKSVPKTSPAKPPPQIYAVHPIIFIATDTSINVENYRNQVNVSFQTVQNWYKDQLGKTFNLLPAIVYESALTESQLQNKYPGGGGMWYDGLGAATAANNLSLCSDHRFYYFITPLDNVWGGWVGAENLGCDHVIPGTASIPNHMGRLVGGIIDPNWPEWWADEIREAQGGVAHEIGHGLGGSCVGNICNGLPHADPSSGSIMYGWWAFGIGAVFTEEEKSIILLNPFISLM